jgi:uncharacterized membrane protein YdjX (TVP38/TMEM64 family)
MPLLGSAVLGYLALALPTFLGSMSVFNMFLVWLLISLAVGLAMVPTTLVAIFAGYTWGWGAFVPLVLGYSLATVIGFFVSKKIDNQQILSLLLAKPKAKQLLRNLDKSQFQVILLARLSPVFPFGVSNAVFAFLGVPLTKLLSAGLLGMLPRTLLAFAAGNQANTWLAAVQAGSLGQHLAWVILASLGSVLLIFYFIFKKN